MSTEPNTVIYSMDGVSKFYDKKAALKDTYFYFYGAKIGVIGLNGSGKSSLQSAWARSQGSRPPTPIFLRARQC